MEKRFSTRQYMAVSLLLGLMLNACGGGSTPPSGTSSTNTTLALEGSQTQKSDATDTTAAAEQAKKEALLSVMKTKTPAEDVTASKEALFIAEGDKGVEIIKIGYHDRIDTKLVTRISGINATSVRISEDQVTLYVQNKEGFVNIYDIRDITSPRRIRITDSSSMDRAPKIRNNRYELEPKEDKGFIVYDISNPSDKSIVARYRNIPAYTITPVDHDTKALVATKTHGIDLLDISDLDHIRKIGNHPLPGETLGLSVDETSGLLFVANGSNGVKIFNLDIFIDSML